jgi:uncharacterized damage-inducible protein DinB
MKSIEKPVAGEFPPYASMYIDLIPNDGLVLQHLEENLKIIKYLMFSLSGEKLAYRYEQGKWTIPEILVHIIDDERIYAYRALRFARNDKTDLPGFEQDDYTHYSDANNRSLESILEEYESVRKSTITLFKNLPDEALLRTGKANNTKVSVRALIYHIAGHELHHLNIIKEKYLKTSH